jgi:hypothetical protein
MTELVGRTSLVVALLLLTSTAPAVAQKPSFPPSVITNQDKIEWIERELASIEAAVKREAQLSPANRSDARLKEMLEKLADTTTVAAQVPGGVPGVVESARRLMNDIVAVYSAAANSRLKIGMTADQVRQIRGEPPRVSEVTTAAGIRQQWRYGTTVLSFDNGKLAEIQQTLKGE